jgi:tRNA (guanine37-N1)-methyltransferase
MLFDILTLFPEMFGNVFSASIIKRAIDKGLLSVRVRDIRDFTGDKHRTVDDYPYGGDAGMLLQPGPVSRAILDSKEWLHDHDPKVIFLSPRGELLTHDIAEQLHREKSLILLCGHYKGVDQRISDTYIDREISIGDYVLSGGELPAMVLVDTIVRLIPGVLGNRDSAEKDSLYNGLLEPPQYTRPEEFEGMRVPDVLLSGHHVNIRKWQEEQAIRITQQRRPDLWEKYLLRRSAGAASPSAKLRNQQPEASEKTH